MKSQKFKQTEIGNIPEDWEVKEIQEVITKLGDGLHGTPKYDNNGEYYFVNGNNLVNDKIKIYPDTKKCSKDEFEKYKKELNDRTILISINGTLGNIALYDNEKIILGKSACYLNIKKEYNLLFIKYILKNKKFQNYLENNATGTTIKNISLKQMREYKFGISTNNLEQQSIASILSSLDEKIELNNKMNKTLEAIGQAIFKKWFIDEKKEEWREVKIEEVVPKEKNSIVDGPFGTQMKIGEYKERGIPIIEMSFLEGYPFYKPFKSFISEEKFEEVKRSLVKKGDIIISKTGTLGLLGIMTDIYPKAIIVSRLAKITPDTKKISRYYLFFILKQLAKEGYWDQISSGSTMPIFNLTHIKSKNIILPDRNLMDKFEGILSVFYDQILDNLQQNQNLYSIRDTLLPKLMSGEIRVK